MSDSLHKPVRQLSYDLPQVNGAAQRLFYDLACGLPGLARGVCTGSAALGSAGAHTPGRLFNRLARRIYAWPASRINKTWPGMPLPADSGAKAVVRPVRQLSRTIANRLEACEVRASEFFRTCFLAGSCRDYRVTFNAF